jgi:hypothetical protein
MKTLYVSLVLAVVATMLPAQVQVALPPLTIDGSALESTVTYDAARGVYTYAYALLAAQTNQTDITGFSVDISGRVARAQLDPDLHNNFEREEISLGQFQPSTAIPIGIHVPEPWVSAGVNRISRVAFALMGPGHDLAPGRQMSGFALESKLPPAWRSATITVSSKPWLPLVRSYPPGSEVEFNYGTPSVFDLQTEVLAPFDLDEPSLFLGGGQSPREVNPFLRYASPTESRIFLPPAATAYEVVVMFGTTTDPATFTAELNGADVRSLFRPMPGVVNSVRIPLVPGTNKLQLSIQGITSSGRTGRDTDTLTMIVK